MTNYLGHSGHGTQTARRGLGARAVRRRAGVPAGTGGGRLDRAAAAGGGSATRGRGRQREACALALLVPNAADVREPAVRRADQSVPAAASQHPQDSRRH